jgi:hypothetical protein
MANPEKKKDEKLHKVSNRDGREGVFAFRIQAVRIPLSHLFSQSIVVPLDVPVGSFVPPTCLSQAMI